MNLTFYENRKENRNNSFSHNLNKLIFPSVFSKFETEKNFYRDSLCIKLAKSKIFLPNYKNIKKELLEVRKQFRNLFNIKNSIFKDMITKNNSHTYKNFVHGFGKYFFGPFGLVSKQNKILRDYYIRTSVLNDKIYAGKLEYLDYINKFNRYKQRQNFANKHLLSMSKNYAIVNDKNDIYSMKALTSNKYFNKRKNFVSLNKLKYRPSVTDINEISPNIKKKINFMNKTFDGKINKNTNKDKNKSVIKFKNKSPNYSKIYSNFYNNKNRNIFSNYKKAVALTDNKKNYKYKYNQKVNQVNNKARTRINSFVNIKFKTEKIKDDKKYNFFLTQGSFNNINDKDKKLSFNKITNLRRNKKSLSKFSKQINIKNKSYNKV